MVSSNSSTITPPVGSLAALVPPPMICLSRSSSQIQEIGSQCSKSVSCDNPSNSNLSVLVADKAKSVSIGDLRSSGVADLSSVSTEENQLNLNKTLSDPIDQVGSSEILSEAPKPMLHKTLSDSKLPASKEACEEYEIVSEQSESKNWLMKKIHRGSKKKEKKNAKGDESHASDNKDNTDKDEDKPKEPSKDNSIESTKSRQHSSEETKEIDGEESNGEDLTNTDVKKNSHPEGNDGKSPSSNRSFFNRVSLKIRSISNRKSSHEEEDIKERDSVPSSAHKAHQKCQDRLSKFKIDVLDLTDDEVKKHSMRRMYLADVLLSRKTVGR